MLAAALAFTPALMAASAPPSPEAAPSPSPSQAPPSVSISASPFSPTNAVTITGTKDVDASVVVTAGSNQLCSVAADEKDTWSCVASIASGADIVLTATATVAGGTATAQSDPVDVLGAPTLNNAGATPGIVSGLGYAGSTVTVTVSGNAAGGCTSPVTPDGYWSCSLAVPSGAWSVTATQRNAALGGGASSSVSGSLSVTIDKDAPAAPVVTSPRAGALITTPTVTYRGTGEDGGSIDVYVANIPVCSTTVSGTEWRCTARSPAKGSYAVLAVLRDRAGNYASPSGEVRVSFAPAVSPSPSPSAPASPSPSTVPAPPAPSPSSPTWPALPNDPWSGGTTDAGRPPTDWQTPTAFGADIPTPVLSISRGTWPIALLAALAFLVLVAMPVRLLATTLHGRRLPRAPRFTGRNRRGEPEAEPSPPVAPWVGIAVSLAAATALIVLSRPVSDEVRYLRLTIAVALGLVILNAAVVAAGRIAAPRLGVTGRPRLVVVMLLAALLTAVLSRLTGIEPPVVAGVVLGMSFAGRIPARPRGGVRLAELAVVLVLALVAWTLVSPLAAASGFWAEFGRELCTTVALAGLGSALVMVLPIANLPGRVILEWSLPIWVGTAVVVATIAAAVFVGAGAGFPVLASLAVAAGFSALSLGLWAWLRFSESLA